MGKIRIVEVAPRDGFQILNTFIPTEAKIGFIKSLIDAGCEEIQASSFVSPKWIPQLRDAEIVCENFRSSSVSEMTYLIPNTKGAQRAVASGAKRIFVTTSASALHCRENLNQTIDDVFKGAEGIAVYAKKNGIYCAGSIAASFGYSRDTEKITKEKIEKLVKRLEAAGFSSVNLSDTSGEANPFYVYDLCSSVLKITTMPVSVHLHQRGGIEFANALAALNAGIRIFESATGGLGGCPNVPNAKGNIATEKLVGMFHEMGFQTNVNLELIEKCANTAKQMERDYGRCD
jgi:hydroxymethylglutaryl-CoA lyase